MHFDGIEGALINPFTIMGSKDRLGFVVQMEAVLIGFIDCGYLDCFHSSPSIRGGHRRVEHLTITQSLDEQIVRVVQTRTNVRKQRRSAPQIAMGAS
jgi:hypothetical protein